MSVANCSSTLSFSTSCSPVVCPPRGFPSPPRTGASTSSAILAVGGGGGSGSIAQTTVCCESGWQRLMRLVEVFVFLESFKAEGATHHGDDARDAGEKDDEEYGDDAGGQGHALPNLATTLATHSLFPSVSSAVFLL